MPLSFCNPKVLDTAGSGAEYCAAGNHRQPNVNLAPPPARCGAFLHGDDPLAGRLIRHPGIEAEDRRRCGIDGKGGARVGAALTARGPRSRARQPSMPPGGGPRGRRRLAEAR